MTDHRPIRRCVSCGARKPQAELLRFAQQADGSLALTTGTSRLGRGAYCCASSACWEKAIVKRLVKRSLKTAVSVDDPEALLALASQRAAQLNIANGVESNGENHR